ncbi:hypothetical protein EVC45_27215 [Paraburkholderia sp. UYCP14C]|uniref:hypothetical protein n=1 Tax=Paraburkholderia sp. UYCP14C TaxID=2511130 RepID=UPI00101FF3D3|nr:hypothetical protein [Paraburkholderia sp. UYCP14C]RZF26571.1 hypothetical protein EVC45_27215 [Paraburkholderia sp. UYCP14C]
MKAETRRWRTFDRTVAMAALLAAPLAAPAASTVTGGVIRFAGMIVAPPMQISTAMAPTGVAVDSASGAGQRFSRTVTFSAPPGVAGGVDIALEVNGGMQSLDAKRTDRDTRVTVVVSYD